MNDFNEDMKATFLVDEIVEMIAIVSDISVTKTELNAYIGDTETGNDFLKRGFYALDPATEKGRLPDFTKNVLVQAPNKGIVSAGTLDKDKNALVRDAFTKAGATKSLTEYRKSALLKAGLPAQMVEVCYTAHNYLTTTSPFARDFVGPEIVAAASQIKLVPPQPSVSKPTLVA